jgi:hypothetical protein
MLVRRLWLFPSLPLCAHVGDLFKCRRFQTPIETSPRVIIRSTERLRDSSSSRLSVIVPAAAVAILPLICLGVNRHNHKAWTAPCATSLLRRRGGSRPTMVGLSRRATALWGQRTRTLPSNPPRLVRKTFTARMENVQRMVVSCNHCNRMEKLQPGP